MSLIGALWTAASGMSASQTATKVASSNITNADTEGYTRKVVSTETVTTSGSITSVRSSVVKSLTDQNLLRSTISSLSDVGYDTVISTYLDKMQNALGSTSDDSDSLATALDELATALDTLASTPESTSAKTAAVDAATTVAEKLNALSDNVQELRSEADQDIGDTVDDINESLNRIDELNDKIVKAQALGQSTADLEDQRANELSALSENLGITYFTDSSNRVKIYTSSGQTLLDGSVHELSFSAATSVSSSVSYDASGGSGLSGITVDGNDITASIDSGTLGGLLTLRDETLPAYQDELDEMAASLISAMNEALNAGTSNPPQSELTGSATVTAGDAIAATGTVRISIIDEDGNATVTELDLSQYSTNQDLVDALDAIDGMSASLDSSGHLVLTADDSSQGIAIGESSSAFSPDGSGFSSYFGLNDLFTGTGAGDIAVRSDIAADASLLATGSLQSDGTLSSGDSGVVIALRDVLSADQSFSAAGKLSASSKTFSEYTADFISQVAQDAQTAEDDLSVSQSVYDGLSDDLANAVGVNIDEETAELTVLENAYSASANVISTIQEMMQAVLDMVE